MKGGFRGLELTFASTLHQDRAYLIVRKFIRKRLSVG